MKKLCLLFLIMILLFTGCSNKKPNFDDKSALICKKTFVEDKTTTNEKIILAYDKNEKINEFEFDIEYVYNHDISKKSMDVAMKGFEIFAKTLGIYFESVESNNSLKFIFAGDFQKFEQVFFEVINSDKKNINDKKNDALKELSKDGYDCVDNEIN